MKHILMITTGGTIASTKTHNGLAPGLSADDLLAALPQLKKICTVKTLQLFSIDSTDMDLPHWQKITQAIEDNYPSFDGFVVCHGTDTLAYTAAALSYMIQGSPKPIVLTGSQKPITEPDTDAVQNLWDSFLYACSDSARDISIVFGGLAIAGTRARKMYTQRYDAFQSINFPVLARIRQGKVLADSTVSNHHPAADCQNNTPVFYYHLSSRVAILKLLPGAGEEILPHLFAHYDGLLIEGYGMGGIPEQYLQPVIDCMQNHAGQTKILLLATQVPFEGTNSQRYAVGQRIERIPFVLELFDMTPEAAAIKLMWLLCDPSVTESPEKLSRYFYQPVNYDICPPISMLPE